MMKLWGHGTSGILFWQALKIKWSSPRDPVVLLLNKIENVPLSAGISNLIYLLFAGKAFLTTGSCDKHVRILWDTMAAVQLGRFCPPEQQQ